MSDAGTVKEGLAFGRGRLAANEASSLEAELLLVHVLGVNRAWLYANGSEPMTADQQRAYRSLLERRVAGEPVAYLAGVREFWSLPLTVNPDVLIPRPETELLVETALEFLPERSACRFADLGTGSGAVALAVASERPRCEVHATDVSAAALAVARENAARLLPGRVFFHPGSWCEPLQGRFRVVASNPPYVAQDDAHLEQGDCRFEPRLALTAGHDGLNAIRELTRQAIRILEPGGCLAFEHGYDQGVAARAVLEQEGYERIETRQDLEHRDRVSLGFRAD